MGKMLVLLAKFCFVSRYGLLLTLFLLTLPWIAFDYAESMLAALFYMKSDNQLFHVTWLSLMAATAAWAMMAVSTKFAPDRLGWTDIWGVTGRVTFGSVGCSRSLFSLSVCESQWLRSGPLKYRLGRFTAGSAQPAG